MWIKICGLTTAAAVDAALAAGVDALGFVFAASPRQLTPQAAVALARAARGRARCVAVMRHPSQGELDEVLSVFRPDLLQSDAADFTALRLPPSLGRLPVLRQAQAAAAALPQRVLFEGPASGSGTTSDWQAAHALARRTEVILAGGLHAGNVAAALAAVAPFGVDVSSGVEERPGMKSIERIAAFVSAVRAAAAAAAAASAASATGGLP
jgi:phosphoribosylanthranilate isomerase